MGVPGVLEPVFLQDFRPLNHDTKMFDELGFSATLANVSVTPDPAQGWDLGGRLIRRQTDLLTHGDETDFRFLDRSAHPPTN